jgi:hypothetical protein
MSFQCPQKVKKVLCKLFTRTGADWIQKVTKNFDDSRIWMPSLAANP